MSPAAPRSTRCLLGARGRRWQRRPRLRGDRISLFSRRRDRHDGRDSQNALPRPAPREKPIVFSARRGGAGKGGRGCGAQDSTHGTDKLRGRGILQSSVVPARRERARQESNLRPRAPEARALSPELRALAVQSSDPARESALSSLFGGGVKEPDQARLRDRSSYIFLSPCLQGRSRKARIVRSIPARRSKRDGGTSPKVGKRSRRRFASLFLFYGQSGRDSW